MRKLLLTLVIGLTIGSCTEPNVDRKYTGIRYGDGDELEEIVIDGCQYIGQFGGFNTDWGTHKGTCNNPIHKENKVTVVDTVEYKLIRE
jgi:hypothetical protein